MPADERLHSLAAERNRQPILEVLQRVLPVRGRALEIASGTGQHVVHFAAGLRSWTWQPTDPDPGARASIAAWTAMCGLPNILAPLDLDVAASPWPLTFPEVDAIFCANMLHISPWACCAALMRGAARHLSSQGLLMTYGPYIVSDVLTAPSNVAFDADLRLRNPQWGVRRLDAVAQEAVAAGLALRETVSMPANNLLLVFGRAEAVAN
jgi:hypothetical protein